jgi:HSP20 family protein
MVQVKSLKPQGLRLKPIKNKTLILKIGDLIMLPILHRSTWLPDVFDDFFDTDFMPRANATAPAINVIENEKDYTVELAAPGLKKDDFQVHISDDGNLQIKFEQKSEDKEKDKKGHYLRREFNYSKYEQTLVLPDDVDKSNISAKVNDGVLYVVLPKLHIEAPKLARQISVE